MGTMELQTLVVYPRLFLTEIRQVAGRLLNGVYLDQPLQKGLEAELVRASQIATGIAPAANIFRMTTQEKVASFFENGKLDLGCLRHWKEMEDKQRKDPTEGRFLLVGRNLRGTLFAEAAGGYDYRGLCCTVGMPVRSLESAFGGSTFRINDPDGFAKAIANSLGVENFIYGRVAYASAKVIFDHLPADYDFTRVDESQLLEIPLYSAGKYFVKPLLYRPEQELRFLWRMGADMTSVQSVICPEAVQFCERI